VDGSVVSATACYGGCLGSIIGGIRKEWQKKLITKSRSLPMSSTVGSGFLCVFPYKEEIIVQTGNLYLLYFKCIIAED
jgi:hypothetical protein